MTTAYMRNTLFSALAALSVLTGAPASSAAEPVELPAAIKASGVLVLGTSASVGLPWTSTKQGTTDEFVGVEPELAGGHRPASRPEIAGSEPGF